MTMKGCHEISQSSPLKKMPEFRNSEGRRDKIVESMCDFYFNSQKFLSIYLLNSFSFLKSNSFMKVSFTATNCFSLSKQFLCLTVCVLYLILKFLF